MTLEPFIIRHYHSVSYDVAIIKVASTLEKEGFLVILNSNQAPIGVLNKFDVLQNSNSIIRDIDFHKPVLNLNCSLSQVLELMTLSGSYVLPVYDHKGFAGVITQLSLIEQLAKYYVKVSEVLKVITKELRPPVANIIGLAASLKEDINELQKQELLTMLNQVSRELFCIIGDFNAY